MTKVYSPTKHKEKLEGRKGTQKDWHSFPFWESRSSPICFLSVWEHRKSDESTLHSLTSPMPFENVVKVQLLCLNYY